MPSHCCLGCCTPPKKRNHTKQKMADFHNEQALPRRHDCGRWTLALAFTILFGLLFLYQSADIFTSRLLPVQDVAFKAATLRGNNNATDNTPIIVTSDSNSSSFQDQGGVPSGKPRLPRQDGAAIAKNSDNKNGNMVGPKPQKSTENTSTLKENDSNKIANEVMDPCYNEYMKACTSSACLNHVQQHKEQWSGDLMNMADVQRLVGESRDQFIEKLKMDYGENNFGKMFQVNGTSRGRRAFVSSHNESDVSIRRFKRKLKIKILAMQMAIQTERESLQESSRRRSLEQYSGRSPDHYEKFVWATGGHSASAGHGNLFNESYTAFMDRAISDIFGAVGIEFEGRSFAMGGTASAPEIALCNEAVFGTDPDVISWDYGMTDANWFFRKAMFNQRIGLNPSRPAIIDLNVGGREFKFRSWINQRVEDRGLTSIYLDPDEFDAIEAMVPDTFGLSKAEVDKMPRFVKHYKCQDAIEKGDPTCGEYKYSNLDICPERKGMASWHPGWKRHALWGNIMALFLSDMLLDSIKELGMSTTTNRTDLLAQLRNEEDEDYEKFFSSFRPDIVEYNLVPLDNDLVDDSNVSFFFRSPSFCHTARLPAQTRHLGILTMTNQVGVHDYEYYKGISMEEANKITNGNDRNSMNMPLVYEPEAREQCDQAEIKRDYMDYFLVTSQMGPRTLTVPNGAERQAYGRESEKPLGIVLICQVTCPWGRCPKGEVQLEEIVNGTLHIDVNEQPVTNVTNFRGCSVLRGKNGHRFPANDAGQYVVKARIPLNDNSTFSFLRISSLVVL